MDNVKVSVVIPTKNGGELFKRVLERVLIQETGFKFNLVIVDSGSKDGTVEFVKERSQVDPRVILFEIQPQEFQHGRTRNFAVEKTNSEFVAFLTQDSLPFDKFWLVNLLNPFKDLEVAGVFGKHIPYKDCYPVEKRQIIDHFDVGFGLKPLKIKIENQEDFEKRKGWYIFYSDNNSCLRKSVWEKIKLPEVEMAEDQKWAEQILLAGYTKAYAPDATIYHSHRYSFKEIIKRYFDEYKFHVQVGNTKRASLIDGIKFFINSFKYSLKIIWTGKFTFFRKIYWSFFYVVYDVCRSYGYYIGTNFEKVNDEDFSMQKEIIRS